MHDEKPSVNGATSHDRWSWDNVVAHDLHCRLTMHDEKHVWAPFDTVTWNDVAQARPARKFHSYPGRKNYSGLYYSSTICRHVPFESFTERSFVMTMDANPNVVSITAQPFMLVGKQADVTVSRFPDFLVVYASGAVEIVDVTTPFRRDVPKVAASFSWTEQAALLRGWSYTVWDGADRNYLRNLSYISMHRRQNRIDVNALQWIERELATAFSRTGSGLSIRDLVNLSPSSIHRAFIIPAALHLVWSGRATVPLTEPLSYATVVTGLGSQ